jgi:hypothetical protein
MIFGEGKEERMGSKIKVAVWTVEGSAERSYLSEASKPGDQNLCR